jgi:hypothetical protein
MQNHIEINAELVRDILAYIRVWKRSQYLKVYAKKEKIFAKQIS